MKERYELKKDMFCLDGQLSLNNEGDLKTVMKKLQSVKNKVLGFSDNITLLENLIQYKDDLTLTDEEYMENFLECYNIKLDSEAINSIAALRLNTTDLKYGRIDTFIPQVLQIHSKDGSTLSEYHTKTIGVIYDKNFKLEEKRYITSDILDLIADKKIVLYGSYDVGGEVLKKDYKFLCKMNETSKKLYVLEENKILDENEYFLYSGFYPEMSHYYRNDISKEDLQKQKNYTNLFACSAIEFLIGNCNVAISDITKESVAKISTIEDIQEMARTRVKYIKRKETKK